MRGGEEEGGRGVWEGGAQREARRRRLPPSRLVGGGGPRRGRGRFFRATGPARGVALGLGLGSRGESVGWCVVRWGGVGCGCGCDVVEMVQMLRRCAEATCCSVPRRLGRFSVRWIRPSRASAHATFVGCARRSRSGPTRRPPCLGALAGSPCGGFVGVGGRLPSAPCGAVVRRRVCAGGVRACVGAFSCVRAGTGRCAATRGWGAGALCDDPYSRPGDARAANGGGGGVLRGNAPRRIDPCIPLVVVAACICVVEHGGRVGGVRTALAPESQVCGPRFPRAGARRAPLACVGVVIARGWTCAVFFFVCRFRFRFQLGKGESRDATRVRVRGRRKLAPPASVHPLRPRRGIRAHACVPCAARGRWRWRWRWRCGVRVALCRTQENARKFSSIYMGSTPGREYQLACFSR
ncbi:hypothetical protein C8F04DRAFT_1327051 [Mycena alexandri]|uniref:Uncharacterized protein n=1 Tax=Mycena alexandri TaxID=1745969 RepID=A0AAD6RZU2_9AGAR|nr:hypothetical protein C8F04DRAFT_1327051 [Mycena alexandri]